MPNFPKTRLGVFAVEDPTLGTAVVTGNTMNVAVIGTSFGAITTIQDEPTTRQTSPDLTDALIHTDVSRVVRVSDTQGGVANYVQGTDYRLTSDSIEWLGTIIPAPSGVAGAALNTTPVSPRTGLAAATYDYVITAIRTSSVVDPLHPVIGETVQSSQVAVVVGSGSPATNAVNLTWTSVTNAQGYRVYRKLSTDPDYTAALIAEIPGGASNFFVDDGYTSGTGTPPVSNTTTNRPADAAIYYATYIATIQNYLVPTTFYSMTDLIKAHSLGSDLTIAGTLILGGTGVGQGASLVTTVSIESTSRANFQAALAALLMKNIDIIVVLSSDPNVQLDTANHVLAASDPITGRVRKAYFGNLKGTQIGDEDTSGTMVWAARRLELLDNDGNPQGQRVVYCAESSIFVDVQQAGGVTVETELDGWFLAAAVAGKVAGNGDPAMPITFKQLQGIDSLGQVFNPSERDVLDSSGLLTCFDDNGVINVYHGRTIDLLTVEHGEINIVNAKDVMYQHLLTAFKPFVGGKITEAFLASLESRTKAQLGVEKKDELIADYDPETVVASQETGVGADPRRIDVTFKATPFYPANQIVFKFGFSL